MADDALKFQKIWKYDSGSEAAYKVTDSSATMQGGKDYGFHSDAKLGNFVKGPVSLTPPPENIRIHGLWTLNPLLLSCIPSSVVTPVSVLKFDLPLSGAEELMKEAVAMMATLLIV
jgi:hypothetical protein